MTILQPGQALGSAASRRHREDHLRLIRRLRQLEAQVRHPQARTVDAYHQRGQLVARERIAQLVDPGSPFFELSSLAGLEWPDEVGAAVSVARSLPPVAGIGAVDRRIVVVLADQRRATPQPLSEVSLRKAVRAIEIAELNGLPLVWLIDRDEIATTPDAVVLELAGRLLGALARLGVGRVPIVMVVYGPSALAGVSLPAFGARVVAVRQRADLASAGPDRVYELLGEDGADDPLGRASRLAKSGANVHCLVEDDDQASSLARRMLALAMPAAAAPASSSASRSRATVAAAAPRYDSEEILSVVPLDFRQPYEVRELLARLVDDSEWFGFREGFGVRTVCGEAGVGGVHCGVIASNGPLDADGAAKASELVRRCDHDGTPVVFLHNTVGALVGERAENAGVGRHVAELVTAVARAEVPCVTLVVGGSRGAGHFALAGRAMAPRLCCSWPLSEQVLAASATVQDDGVVDPRQSREVLRRCLAICAVPGGSL